MLTQFTKTVIFMLFVFLQYGYGQAKQKMLAVTMDDLPLNIASQVSNNEMRWIVERLLEQIRTEKIPVTAFVNEKKIDVSDSRDPERIAILKLWLNAKVDLGNHTYSHKSQNEISVSEAKMEIIRGERTIKELLALQNRKPKYFRHPYLQTGRDSLTRVTITQYLDSLGYTIAPVTIDNAEWIFASAFDKSFLKKDSAQMSLIGFEYLSYMKSKLHFYEWLSDTLFGRQIKQILLIHSNRLNSYYFSALCSMFRTEGYSFISLEEALRDSAYRTADTFYGAGGISWLDRWALTKGYKGKFFSGDPHVPQQIMDLAGVKFE